MTQRDVLVGEQPDAGLTAFSQVRIGYRMLTQLGVLERFHETLKAELALGSEPPTAG